MRKLLLIFSVFMMMSGLSLAQDDELTPYEIASKWIEKAERTHAFELNLMFLELDTIPSEIGKLNNLVFLEASVNALTDLPPEIGQLSNLYNLDLYYNKISILPSEIGQLSELQKLNLASNQLTQLPPELGQLAKLHKLWVGINQLTDIPSEIGQLSNLYTLSLNKNQLVSLPSEIGQLENLCQLDISNNKLESLPSELGQLTKLADDGCYLKLDGNPLISPPPEVIAQGTPAVLDYLRNQAWWHLQRLILSGATGLGLLAVLMLGIRWRTGRNRRKAKRKNDVT